ncbi:MAG TPA: acyl carrier protein, partial [Thermoanaerobaculia bacterium]|nr:acyl carrier protein [Thermoanaerobaculia bacterium]
MKTGEASLGSLRRLAARALALDAAALPVDRPLAACGLDSLGAAELSQAIELELGVRVDLGDLLAAPSLEILAASIAT